MLACSMPITTVNIKQKLVGETVSMANIIVCFVVVDNNHKIMYLYYLAEVS